MRWLRSAIYFVWFILLSVVLHVAFMPAMLVSRRGAVAAARLWCGGILWGLRTFCGLGYEVRGSIPASPALVAAKHMSMWDTVALFYLIGDPVFILKRELMRIPFYGWYARRVGMIAIDRHAGGAALRSMTKDARDAMARGLSVVIFPEGTRKKPGAAPDYKPGVAALYQRLDAPCIPVALDSGLYWAGPAGFLKKPGQIALQFLPPIPAGLRRQEFMATLETTIEQATTSLVREARGAISAARE